MPRRCLGCKHLLYKILQRIACAKRPAKISDLCDIIPKNILMDQLYSYMLPTALIMASATPAASWRGQNVQASDKYGMRGFWRLSAAAESGRCGDRSPPDKDITP